MDRVMELCGEFEAGKITAIQFRSRFIAAFTRITSEEETKEFVALLTENFDVLVSDKET